MEADKNKEFCFSTLLCGSFCLRQSIMTPHTLPSLPAWPFSPIISQRWRASLGFHAECICFIVYASSSWIHRSSAFCPRSKLAGGQRHIKHVRTALCPKDYASSIYPQAQCCFSIVIYFWTETVLHQTGSKDEKRYSSLPMTNICEHIDCTNFFVLSHVFFTAVDLFCAHRVSSTSHTSLWRFWEIIQR